MSESGGFFGSDSADVGSMEHLESANSDELLVDGCVAEWYCDYCYRGMLDENEGFVRHSIAFCSESCADKSDAQR